MSILKTTVLLSVLVANEANGIKVGDKLIEKYKKLSKIGKLSKGLKLSKSWNSKGKKLA